MEYKNQATAKQFTSIDIVIKEFQSPRFHEFLQERNLQVAERLFTKASVIRISIVNDIKKANLRASLSKAFMKAPT